MKQTINFTQFCDSLKGQFSYEGKKALFESLEQYEEDTGEEIELDPIALCCEYTEYDNLKDLQADYPDIKDMDDLRDNTIVIPIYDITGTGKETDRFIIQQY